MGDSPETSRLRTRGSSLQLFILTVLATVTGLLAALRLFAPDIFVTQFASPLWKGGLVFLAISLVICFAEYFYHRYVLGSPSIPFLRRFYRPTQTHRIAERETYDGRRILFLESKSSVAELSVNEESAFPWYSFAIFGVMWTPLLALLQWVFPAFPWLVGGFAAIAVSLTFYQLLHAIHQWSFERWEPLIEHPLWGKFWRPIYAFHLGHHAVAGSNESISGFFGLPLADWVFGTCVFPKTLYCSGEESTPDSLPSPRPIRLIRWCDEWARRGALESTTRVVRREKRERPYTRGEEVANWVTHGVGLFASVVGLALLIFFSLHRGNIWHLVSFTVFGVTLLILYAASTIYHLHRDEKAKLLFRKLDHAAIFLLIAGTYTPFLLTELRGPWGWTLFAIIWMLCGTGAILQLFLYGRYRLASTFAYLFAGWLIVVALKPLIENVPPGGLWLLVAGGLSYTIGVVFFLWHRLLYHHAVWHLFVLGGSACHFLAVLLYLLPPNG